MSASTMTTIAGQRREIVFGRRYLIAASGGVRGEVIVVGRRRNGDLLIEDPDPERHLDAYVKVASIASLTAIPDSVDEVESEAGQATLEAAHKAAVAARNGKAPKRPKVEAPDFGPDAGDPAERETPGPYAYDPDGYQPTPEELEELRSKPSRESLATGVGSPAEPRRSGRPYSERNQVWKCGTCGRRTRLEVCVGSTARQPNLPEHPPVHAPAGKRRESRS